MSPTECYGLSAYDLLLFVTVLGHRPRTLAEYVLRRDQAETGMVSGRSVLR